MTWRRTLLMATVSGLLLWLVAACAGTGSSGARGAGPAPGTPGASEPPSGSAALGDAAAQVEEIAARYADRYAGLEIASGGLVVYRKPGGELDPAVRAALPRVRIEFRDAPYSRAELAALSKRILADGDYWAARGVPLWTVGARHDGTGVEVGTPAGDKLLADSPARYGTVPIIVVPMTSQPVPLNP